MFGSQLVTYQNAPDGQPASSAFRRAQCIAELYLSAIVDRASQQVIFMTSSEGGVEIEQVAEATPEKIFRFTVKTLVGVVPYQCREMAFVTGWKANQTIYRFMTKLYQLFM